MNHASVQWWEGLQWWEELHYISLNHNHVTDGIFHLIGQVYVLIKTPPRLSPIGHQAPVDTQHVDSPMGTLTQFVNLPLHTHTGSKSEGVFNRRHSLAETEEVSLQEREDQFGDS